MLFGFLDPDPTCPGRVGPDLQFDLDRFHLWYLRMYVALAICYFYLADADGTVFEEESSLGAIAPGVQCVLDLHPQTGMIYLLNIIKL